MRTSLLLADHNRLLRQGLRELLKGCGEFEVIAEARDSGEAIGIAITRAPDLILIDSRLPGLDETNAVTQIKRRLPDVRIVMLAAAAEDALPDSRPGADAYVRKDVSFEGFLEVLRRVDAGKRSPDHAAAAPLSRLTPRERGILESIAQGRTNRATAGLLGVSQKTVEKHRASLMRKLGVHNATELMFTAAEMGLVRRTGMARRAIVGVEFDARATAP